MLVGCSAGFLNVMKIKGAHNAMKSGILAGEKAFFGIVTDENRGKGKEIKEYEEELKKSWVKRF
jgi:electron-transferring-flavoprotein dehydrogenase